MNDVSEKFTISYIYIAFYGLYGELAHTHLLFGCITLETVIYVEISVDKGLGMK